MPLNFFYTTVQKSQKWPKTQIRRGGPALRQAWTDQKRDIWRRYISHFLHQSVPFTSEICRSKFQRCSSIGSGRKGRGKNDRFDPLGGAVPGCCTWQGIATRAKQQEKVGLPSRMSSSWTWLYDLGSLTSKQKRCSLFKLLLVKHHLAWACWSLSSHYRWCRRTFKETSAVHLRRPVRTLPFQRRGLRLRQQAS